MQKKSLFSRLDWVNTAFLTLSPITAIVGTWAHFAYEGFNPNMIWLFFGMCVITIFAISGGYHRLFAHRAYETTWWMKVFYLAFGAATFQNTALKWCTDHRRHHNQVDTKEDPYNIKQGFWYAHIGWIFLKEKKKYDGKFAPDLEHDKLVYFQHKYYVLIGTIFGVGVPTLIGWMMGSPIGGFAIGGFLRIVVIHHLTFLINSACHYFGTQTYSDGVTARDSWILGFLTFGEGYHNFHHAFQGDFRNGFRWYHWDPTKWIVRGLEKCGWATKLKRAPDETVLKAKLMMDEKRMKKKILKMPKFQMKFEMSSLPAFRKKVEDAQRRFLALKSEYKTAKKKELKAKIKQAKHDFKVAYAQWVQFKKAVFHAA